MRTGPLAAAVMAGVGYLMTPYLRSIGVLRENDPFRKIGFLVGLAMIFSAGIVDLTFIAVEAVRRVRARSAQPAPVIQSGGLSTGRLVLWVAVLALAALVVALMRQVGVLYERVAPAGALMTGRGPAVGEAPPVVHVDDLAGAHHDVGARRTDGRGTLVFFLSPTCPVCKTLLPVVRSLVAGAWNP